MGNYTVYFSPPFKTPPTLTGNAIPAANAVVSFQGATPGSVNINVEVGSTNAQYDTQLFFHAEGMA